MVKSILRPFVFLLFCLLAGVGAAQTDEQLENLAVWSATASRAATVLEQKQASNPSLEILRTELAGQRSAAQAMYQEGLAAVTDLAAQLAALGPVPEGDVPEPPEIAAFRAETTQALARANVPVLEADVAYRRANDLIKQIDSLIRARINEQLTTLGPSPLNPALFGKVIAELGRYSTRVWNEISEPFGPEQIYRGQLLHRLPFLILVIVVSFAALFGALPILLRRLGRLIENAGTPGRRLGWALLLNIMRIVIPGLVAAGLIWAVEFSGIPGFWSQAIARELPIIAVIAVGSYWLGNSLTGGRWATRSIGIISVEYKKPARRIIAMLGLILILKTLADAIVGRMVLAPDVTAAIEFPIVLLGSFFLYRAARLIKISTDPGKDDGFNVAFLRFIRRAVLVLSIASPILAAIGYFAAAQFLLYPTILSLALLGTAYVVFAIIVEVLESWLGSDIQEDGKSDLRLLPVLLGFMIVLGTVPFLALIWGARVSDLTEIWVLLNDGIPLGESRISPSVVFVFGMVFTLGYMLTRVLQKVFRTSVLPRTRMDTGGKNAILSGISYVGFTLAALAAISATGIDLSSLAIVAGALSVGIGFGLQNIVSNFVSGIILLIERPIKEGDWIEAGPYSGYVRKIAVRSTIIETFERSQVIVPNSDLVAGPVLNWTHSNMVGRVKVPVGVAYGTDPRLVEKIMLGIAEKHPMVVKDPAPSVIFQGFGADSMDFEIRAFLRDVNWMLSARSDMNFEIVRLFAEHNIEIPFAQRDINLKNINELGAAIRGDKPEA
ncbi:MAG: DUF3772 domain-containing protein [Rhodobacteraceae bacterium]|nr:DUF3772 domain-containing protein [Paracoccaceae bacterium]